MSKKKKLLVAALAICLLSTVSFSTLAWFNASQSVTNKFMVATTGGGLGGGSTPSTPQDKIFSVDLWEYVADENGDGTPDKKVNYREDGTSEYEYANILPGVPYIKQPVVENTGSYDQYIRVVVTVSKAGEWTTLLAKYGITNMGTIFLGHDDTDTDGDPAEWECHTAGSFTNATENTISFVYYLNEKLTPGAMASLFEKVQLPGVLTQEDMATLMDSTGEIGFDIAIRADAIQTEGLGNGIDNAQEAFESIGWTAEKTYTDAMTP